MRELLSNISLFVGQLYGDKSLALRARDLLLLCFYQYIKGSPNFAVWVSPRDFCTNHIVGQSRLRGACASTQSHRSLRYSHTHTMEVDVGLDQN